MTLDEYILQHIDEEGDYLKALYRDTHLKLLYPRMASGHLQGRMLKMFVRMIRPRQVLEIGTYSGYSALCMAEGLPDDGMLHTFEINDEQEDFTRPWLENSPYADKIKFYIGNALELVPRLDITFDLAFIDGDKRRYIDYYEMVLARLSDGGYIIADNTLWGSCAIDFAYSVHSAVGNKMVGARVNGKLVPIETELHNGDRVEIITSQNSKGPSRDWLKIAKSSQAKSRINQWFRQQNKTDNIVKGKEMLTNYAKLKGKNLGIYTKPMYEEAVMRKYGFRDWDSVLAAIGHGGLKEGQVLNKLIETYEKQHKKEITDEQVLEAASGEKVLPVGKSKGGIVVRGIHDVAVRFSKCCNPIPGDEIVGFVTRGRGVTIHRTDCVNVLNLPESERARLIDAEWQAEDNGGSLYTVEISVYANNRTGLLVDISKIFTERKIDLAAMNVRTSKQGTASIDVTFDVHNNEELNSIIEKVRQVESVIDIQRSKG